MIIKGMASTMNRKEKKKREGGRSARSTKGEIKGEGRVKKIKKACCNYGEGKSTLEKKKKKKKKLDVFVKRRRADILTV